MLRLPPKRTVTFYLDRFELGGDLLCAPLSPFTKQNIARSDR
jgi:hypothetical protein